MSAFFGILLALLAIFLILLVLVQRGRGGGLAGALGGMGGSSAFGAKAGDIFTRITIIVVSIWITLCIIAGHWAKHRGDLLGKEIPANAAAQDQTTAEIIGPKFTPPDGGDKGKMPDTSPAAAGAERPPASTEGKGAPPPATTDK
ncbi:MAG: preprotein translocase subunit SecG [Pirellulales bacterium]